MENMIDKVFEMLRKDGTRYVVNKEKQYELERLAKVIQLVITKATTTKSLNPYCTCLNVLNNHKREILDMQCLLVISQTIPFLLKQESVTISEIFEDFEKHNALPLEQVKKLIVTAIANGYLEASEK